jgi:hypothetical protein
MALREGNSAVQWAGTRPGDKPSWPEATSLCAGHVQQFGGASPSGQPDGGEGLVMMQGLSPPALRGNTTYRSVHP